MSKFVAALIVVPAAFLVAMPIIFVRAAVNGWGLSILWNWFIPGIFEGVPRLTVGTAIAVALIVGMLTKQTQQTIKEDPDDKRIRQAAEVMSPFICLFFGWVVRWWFF